MATTKAKTEDYLVKNIMIAHLGELAALGTALCWTFNSMAYEAAGKKVGSLSVNYLRLPVAFLLCSVGAFVTRGIFLPIDASGHAWIWLLVSGLLGFVLGDIFLFEAYVQIGSRISLLIMSASPPLAALMGFLLLGEKISVLGLAGIFLTMIGIGLVILNRNPHEKKVHFNRPVKGILYASLGALGQALGLIFSKYGMGSYNAFSATQIRLIAASIGFTILITARKKWPQITASFSNKRALGQIAVGSVLGPFIGVNLSLLALQHTATGIVSSITSISPIIIIPISILVLKEKVAPKEILGACVSILGVILLFL